MIKIVAGNSSGSRSSTRNASVGVIWPLANVVVLLTGLDSYSVGSWPVGCYSTWRALSMLWVLLVGLGYRVRFTSPVCADV